MQTKQSLIAYAVGAALLLFGGVVWAQAGSGSSNEAGDDAAPSKKELAKDFESFELIEEDVASLSGDQKLEKARSKIEEMRKTLDRTNQLLTEVREKEKDILKINCINEKLAAIKGFVKVSEQSYANLERAVGQGDDEAANHHYKLVAVAFQKVRTLGEEALLCTGEEQRYVGETELEVQVPPTAPPIDEPVDDEVVEDLPELTPFQ